MKNTLLTTIALFTALTLGGCGDEGAPGTSHSDSDSGNELLAYVPADTPYVVANLEPVPEKVLDAFLTRLQPVLDAMQSQLTSARGVLESQQDFPDDPGARFAQALLQEFDGKLSRPGLESMGFDLRSKRVLYGMGAFPVIRVGLSDSQALRSTVTRILESAQITAPEQNFQGVSFWRVSDEGHPGVSAGLYISIFDDHLAITVFPTTAEAELLPAFLGLELPQNGNALAMLKQLNDSNDYTGYGTGILDVRKLADQFISPDSIAGRAMAESGGFDPNTISQECVTEIHSIIAHTPRMTVGVKELSESAVAIQYRLETPSTLSSQLMGLVSRIPAANTATDRILELAFGMRFGPVREFLREKANAIVNEPYKCELLAELNTSAVEALQQIDQPMPPFLNNFRGFRVSLSEMSINTYSVPENARGFLAVDVEQPQMFVGMAQMFLPDLSTLAISPGEPPVQLPESLIPVPGLITFAAMTDSAIGLSMGQGEELGLTDFLERKAGPEGTFLSASYDMATYLEYSGKFDDYHTGGDDTEDGGYPELGKIQHAAMQAMQQMADRSDSSMRFTPAGLVIENRMTFK